MTLITKPRLEYEAQEAPGGLPVIVVAAGGSSRMGGFNKQLMLLCGIPVLIRTLLAFETSPYISRIIVVTAEAIMQEVQRLCDGYSLEKLTDITAGGADRHASVLCGMARLSTEETQVLIHDGARPLVQDFVIGNVAAALQKSDAVVCGVPIRDTVKRVAEDGTVIQTVDRTGLFAAQTPQGVNVPKYLAACERLADTVSFTDDVSVMEAAGYSTITVEGSYKNLKITTPEDMRLAELYIGEER